MPIDPTCADSIDTLIVRQLPAWLATAGIDQLLVLHRVLREQQQTAARVRRFFAGFPSLDTFAEPLLAHALHEAGLPAANVRRMQVAITQKVELPSAAPRIHVPTHTYRTRQSLLAAALHNFHEDEAKSSVSRQAQLLDGQGRRLALGFEVFVHCCRQLDIGGRYQKVLHAKFHPKQFPGTPPGFATRQIERLLEDNLRLRFEADVRIARLKGQLTEISYLRLLPVSAGQPVVPAVTGTVTPRQLFLLGKRISGVATLELRATADAPVASVIAWVDQDPFSAISEYPSWEALYAGLAVRLRKSRYRAFFMRFISERDRPAFDAALGWWAKSDAEGTELTLDGRHFALDSALFIHLRALQVNKLMDDAKVLAVPTGEEDMQRRHERLQSAIGVGLDLLNLAGLFVPVLGEIMCAVAAVQIADEVYEGYRDWRVGDRQGALDHVFGVAQSVAVGAAVGAIGGAAVREIKRVAFVDGLSPHYLGGRGLRLARTAASPYALEHAGDLVRCAGGEFSQVPDATAEALLQVTGMQPEQLRRLHAEEAQMPARLLDVHARVRLHEEHADLPADDVQALLASQSSPVSPAQSLLIRDFPGLSVHQAAEILDQASTVQIDALVEQQRVPLALAERARWQVRDGRLDRALLGLHLAPAINADTQRLALGLISEHAPWPVSVRLEVRDGAMAGPLLATKGSSAASEVRVIVKDQQGYHATSEMAAAHSQPDDNLFQALLLNLDDEQKAQLGDLGLDQEGLREWLFQQACSNREQAAGLIGMTPIGTGLRAPRRFADGRLGYPLSGRGENSRQAIRRGIHQLFPTLSDAQLEAYVLDLLSRRVNLWDHYSELQRSLLRLTRSLDEWQAQGSLLHVLRRRRVASQLRRCWRRKLVGLGDEYVLVIEGERIGSLPVLPADVSFGHVRRLVLRDMQLGSIDAAFLSRFNSIVELDLRENGLTQIPAGLEQLTQLRQLHLGHNRIVMSEADNARLATLRHLRTLDLSYNPLGQAPELHALHPLARVNLRGAGLEVVPRMAPRLSIRGLTDLRNNRIRELRLDLDNLRQRLRCMDLHDNPLGEASEVQIDLANGVEPSATRGSITFQHFSIDDRVRDHWLGDVAGAERDSRQALWLRLRSEPGSDDLFRFLADFSGSDDFANHPNHYRARIWRILEVCEQHEGLRTRLFQEAGGERTCTDRLLLVLGQLELGVLIQQATLDVPVAQVEAHLLRLERSLSRLDYLDGIATRHIERMHTTRPGRVDEIEVRLYYRVKLRKALGLPAQPRSMHYEAFANVTTSDLRRAEREVLAAENREALIASMAQRPFWQAYVRERHEDRFEALAAPYFERLEALDESAVTSGELVQASNALMAELDVAERDLIYALAREAWQRSAPD